MQDSNSPDKPIGAVFTPLQWAKWLVRELNLVPKWQGGASICDPTAGQGVFVHALMDVAAEMGIEVSDSLLSRIHLIERERSFIRSFQSSFEFKYRRKFPIKNTVCADVILENPKSKFDLLVGNPPWVNFCDLPLAYKEKLKRMFIEYELIDDKQSLLLGGSRVDLSALIISVVIHRNLADHGEAAFFLPLSLFLNDGAHSGFRRFTLKDSTFQIAKLWDFRTEKIFPEIATRFGVAHFLRDGVTTFPISCRTLEDGEWTSRLAAPLGNHTAPLSVFDSLCEFNELSSSIQIEVRENQKPRQGVNSCGANHVFIFDHVPDAIPSEFIFPLITKECFSELACAPRKFILLPYDIHTGRPLSEAQLRAHPSLHDYLLRHKDKLLSRKGTMLNASMKQGKWWACLGVGEYNFAPFKIVWEAYGKKTFNPRIFSSHNMKPWQANQAMHAFIPCNSLSEAEHLLKQFENSNIEKYLKSLNMEGTCNWAQPGRIKRFLSFKNEKEEETTSLELQFS